MRGSGFGLGLVTAAVLVAPVAGQGYRLRLDTRYQAVSFRGIVADSIPLSQVVTRPGFGPATPDGYAVSCSPVVAYCFYYRPGPKLQGHPLSGTGDLTLWGFGVRGLTLHASGRYTTDLSSSVDYAGTRPEAMLIEGYLEYTGSRFGGRLGRQTLSSRLGYQGFDGAWATVRDVGLGVDAAVFGGWGLARGVALPVTTPALNPLDDFQPRDRQLLFGGEVGIRRGWVDFRADYRRELDPVPDYLVSERASASVSLAPLPGWRLSGGAEYDFANDWWGSADASLSYTQDRFYATASAKRYRPFFDLWTIWGMFTPVPYRSVSGVAAIRPIKRLWIRAQGEGYWFDEAGVSTALVTVEDHGWRAAVGLTALVDDRWTVDAGFRSEFGPGASSRAFDGSVTFRPSERLTLVGSASTLERPLEFRFSESNLQWYALSGDVRLNGQWRLVGDVAWLSETRDRPDAAGLDWNQLRASTRLVWTLGSAADRLPPGRPRPGGGR